MKLKGITIEDFVNYKKPSMFLITCYCNWKCCVEAGISESICQNSELSTQKEIEYTNEQLYDYYIKNEITKAIVFGGLEPMLQFDEVLSLIDYFREHGCDDDVVIYTGYCPVEIKDKLQQLMKYKNIIVKFGRYVPDNEKHFDEVLGVYLISDNQYGEKIS